MSESFWRKLRVALAAGPIHSQTVPRPDLAAGRFFDRGLDVRQRIELFAERAVSCGSQVHRLRAADEAVGTIRSLVPAGAIVLIDPALPFVDRLQHALAGHGRAVQLDQADDQTLFDAAVAVTTVDFALAETGSIVVSARTPQCRLASTVTEIHIAVIRPDQIAADLMDLPDRFAAAYGDHLSGGVTIISGPSKTADIEMNLVIGVHGPAQLHLVVVPQ